jgi:hypothetical protein
LAGEPLGEQDEVGGDAGLGGELLVAGGQEQLDDLGPEDAFELAVQVVGRASHGELLLEGQVGQVRHGEPP